MPEKLGEGLYLAGVGMGVVFLSLIAFMLILYALQKLFPSKEDVEEAEVDESVAQAETGTPQQAVEEPTAETVAEAQEGTSGARVAAIAVATYLAAEQDEQEDVAPEEHRAAVPSLEDATWSILGRDPVWGTQGRRPPPYRQRIQGAYPPQDRPKE